MHVKTVGLLSAAAVATLAAAATMAFAHASAERRKEANLSISSHLQSQLDSDFSPGIARVMSVELVEASGRFDGSANLNVIGQPMFLPFTATSDGTSTVVSISAAELHRVQVAFEGTLASLAGKPSDFILDPRFRALFPSELSRDRADFVTRLSTVDEIVDTGPYYYGHGCKAHRCTTDQAAWTIEKKTGHLVAVTAHVDIGTTSKPDVSVNIGLYGNPKGQDDLTPPLEGWKNALTQTLNSAANDVGLLDAMRGAAKSAGTPTLN